MHSHGWTVFRVAYLMHRCWILAENITVMHSKEGAEPVMDRGLIANGEPLPGRLQRKQGFPIGGIELCDVAFQHFKD